MTCEEKLKIAESRVLFWKCQAILAACGERKLDNLMWGIALTAFGAPEKSELDELLKRTMDTAKRFLEPEQAALLRKIVL